MNTSDLIAENERLGIKARKQAEQIKELKAIHKHITDDWRRLCDTRDAENQLLTKQIKELESILIAVRGDIWSNDLDKRLKQALK